LLGARHGRQYDPNEKAKTKRQQISRHDFSSSI
jgi:hypothetical protein